MMMIIYFFIKIMKTTHKPTDVINIYVDVFADMYICVFVCVSVCISVIHIVCIPVYICMYVCICVIHIVCCACWGHSSADERNPSSNARGTSSSLHPLHCPTSPLHCLLLHQLPWHAMHCNAIKIVQCNAIVEALASSNAHACNACQCNGNSLMQRNSWATSDVRPWVGQQQISAASLTCFGLSPFQKWLQQWQLVSW